MKMTLLVLILSTGSLIASAADKPGIVLRCKNGDGSKTVCESDYMKISGGQVSLLNFTENSGSETIANLPNAQCIVEPKIYYSLKNE